MVGACRKKRKTEVGVCAVLVFGGIGLLVKAIRGGQDPIQGRHLQGLWNDRPVIAENHPVAEDFLIGGREQLNNANEAARHAQQEATHVNQQIERVEDAEALLTEIAGQERLVEARANVTPQLAAERVNELADDPAAMGDIRLGVDAIVDAAVQQLEQNDLSRVSSVVASETSQFNESFSARGQAVVR